MFSLKFPKAFAFRNKVILRFSSDFLMHLPILKVKGGHHTPGQGGVVTTRLARGGGHHTPGLPPKPNNEALCYGAIPRPPHFLAKRVFT